MTSRAAKYMYDYMCAGPGDVGGDINPWSVCRTVGLTNQRGVEFPRWEGAVRRRRPFPHTVADRPSLNGQRPLFDSASILARCAELLDSDIEDGGPSEPGELSEWNMP